MGKHINNQSAILRYAMEHDGQITTQQAYDLCGHKYYCNGEHYVQESLGRMVRSGLLVRERRGHYRVNLSSPGLMRGRDAHNPKQQKLF